MKSQLLDGPLQRQILLLKLTHEMENRPQFGEKFDNNPDGEVRKWLARVGALMNRVGILEGVNFRDHLGTTARYWKPAINSAQVSVLDAIETIRLEFDLYPDDSLGEIYDAGDVFRFLKDLTKIVSSAASDILIVDSFFDSGTFGEIFSSNFRVPIRILCNRNFSALKLTSEKFSAETGISCEVHASNELHDRLIIIDHDSCWLVGASMKDGGKKPTYMLPLVPEMAERKLEIYKRIWENAGTGI